MIPSLRNKDDSKLIGTLNDVIYGYVIEERNGNFECELQYSIFSENWDKLVEENIIVADASDTLKAQKFRIYKTTKPMNGIFTVYALHISFDTAKDMIDDIVVENQSCEYCLNKIFASSQFSQKYKGYSDIVNSQSFSIKSTKVLSSIAGESGSILDTFGTGAEILRDNYDFHVLNSRGHDNDVTIEYGKNLKDINFEVDTSSMITRIKPYAIYTDEAGNEITVYSNPKYVDSPNINNYATPYTESIDFSDKFGYDEIPTSAKLIYLAEKYFIDNNCDRPKISIKISFIPLSKCIGYEDLKDKISLCDTVTIIDSRYNYKDKAKVVKATYDFISERYESMEIGEPRTTLGNIIGGSGDSNKGEQGPPGPQGPPGADGNIGDFPDTLPIAPTLSSTLYGFANIELSWTFEDKTYYTYELYASKIKNFKPSIFDAIFIGKASSFLFQAKPNETWYFKVRCVNTHGRGTDFSSQVTVTTTKVDDLSDYVDNAAIGDALIGTLTLDRGWVGTLKGNYIDAKQLSVTDGNGKRTLFIDSFGNVSLDVTELKISSKNVATSEKVSESISLAVKDFITDDKLQESINEAIDGKISPEDLEKEISKVKIDSIKNTFEAITIEYKNNKKRAELLISLLSTSDGLTDTTTVMQETLNDYITDYTTLSNIVNSLGEDEILTEEEVTDYSNALALLQASSLSLMEKIQISDKAIAENDTNSAIDSAIEDLPTISDLESAENNAILSAKIETIKQVFSTIEVEYANVAEQANIIFLDSYLEGTAESNLGAAILDFDNKFAILLAAQNEIVSDNTLSATELENWNTALSEFQSSVTTISKRIQEAQTYINTAIYNASIEYTNETIPDALTGYAKTSYVDGAMKQAVNDAKDGMVSSTDLTINNTEILMSAASMGQYNLLRNSDFRNGLENWTRWGVTSPHTLSIVKTGDSAMNGENNACFSSLNATVGSLNIGFYQEVILVPDSTYTLSYWTNCTNSTIRLSIISRDASDTASTLAYKSYTDINGTKDRNTWKFDSITFVVPSDSAKIRVTLSISSCTNASYNAYLVKPMLVSGTVAQSWTGHPDEIYVGVVSITEKKGLMVEHSNINTKTIMSADGFSIEDNNGDVLAWLSSKDQWTELKADKVFANNIENVYEGAANLYVDHSKAVAGDGSSKNPFNSFAALKEHLEQAPVINKDLFITVRDPGFEINEQLYLTRLKGTGYIRIILEGNLVIRSRGEGQPCIRLAQIPKFVWIVSGREFGSATTGAVLSDAGKGHGIIAYDIDRLEVDALTIACSNWGIMTERVHLYTWHVDFGKCYNAVELQYQSLYYSSDDVGSNVDFVRLRSGSFAYWGCGSVRPQGNVQRSNGMYYDGGISLTPTASSRYPSANPTPPPTGNQSYTYSYNWTSYKTYAYQWNNWSDNDCKQGSWGYGLRGGHMFFDLATIRSQMNGTILDGNTITLTRATSGGLSGDSNVYINGSTCSSPSGTPSYGGQTLLGTLKWGETKTFTLPKAIVQGLVNGTYNSLAIYVNSSAQNNYLNIVNCSITLKVSK